MSDERTTTTSFSHQRRRDLPEHQRAPGEPTALTRAEFERARTGASAADDRARITAHTAEGPPQPALVLPDPRPGFAPQAPDERLLAATPDRSVTMARDELKGAFVKARLGQSAATVPRKKGR